MLIKLLVTIFVIFAVSRVVLRARDGSLGVLPAIMWLALWIGLEVFVWLPQVSNIIAVKVGIGRGVDALVYIAVVVLFYGIFRIYIKLEFIERELTLLVRRLALRSPNEPLREQDGSTDRK